MEEDENSGSRRKISEKISPLAGFVGHTSLASFKLVVRVRLDAFSTFVSGCGKCGRSVREDRKKLLENGEV